MPCGGKENGRHPIALYQQKERTIHAGDRRGRHRRHANRVHEYPSAKHDDTIDSISQYLNWVRSQSNSLFSFDFFLNEAVQGVPDPEWLAAR